MARRTKAWLTPDAGDTSVVRGCLEIPTPLLPMVTGALSALTEVWNWQAFGTMTPEDAAEAATRMLFAFEDGTCSDMNCEDVLACMLPYLQANLYDDATIRLHPTNEWPQVSYDGGTTWTDIPQTGNGTINAPAPTPTAGVNDDAKICLAATRATLVLAEFYKQTFGAFTANVMNALGTANSFLQDIKMALFNAIYSPYDGIVEAAGFLEQDFETNYTAGELSSGNIEDLLCLLVANASVDASGVVTFDYGAVRDNVISDIGINPGTALWFLLGNMQGAGLNAAGSTPIPDVPMNCSPCLDETWCYRFAFTGGEQGFSVVLANGVVPLATYVANNFYNARIVNGQTNLRIQRTMPETIVTSIEIQATVWNTSPQTAWAGNQTSDDLWNFDPFAVDVPGQVRTEVGWMPFAAGDILRVDLFSTLGTGDWAIMYVELQGVGANPFGTDNC